MSPHISRVPSPMIASLLATRFIGIFIVLLRVVVPNMDDHPHFLEFLKIFRLLDSTRRTQIAVRVGRRGNEKNS